MAEYIPPDEPQESILGSDNPMTSSNSKLVEWKLYTMWYSSYCNYLYSMLYTEQAFKMCKDGRTSKDTTPNDVDVEVVKRMQENEKEWMKVYKNKTTSSKPTVKSGQQQPPPIPLRLIGYKTKRAKFINRLIADIIDHAIVLFLIVLLSEFNDENWYYELYQSGFKLIRELKQIDPHDDETLWITFVTLVVSVLLIFFRAFSLIYELALVALIGTTAGKWVTGLSVVECVEVTTQQDDVIIVKPGRPLTLKSTLLRTFLKNVFRYLVPLILCFISTKGGRTLYDELSNSAVVYKRQLWEPVYN